MSSKIVNFFDVIFRVKRLVIDRIKVALIRLREGFIVSQHGNREKIRLRAGFIGPQHGNREKIRLRAGFIGPQRANREKIRLIQVM